MDLFLGSFQGGHGASLRTFPALSEGKWEVLPTADDANLASPHAHTCVCDSIYIYMYMYTCEYIYIYTCT